jgi:hypothetical protein
MSDTNEALGFVENARAARGPSSFATDPMEARSDDSAAMLDYWDKTDDLIGGIRTMRAAGERWLPKFPDEDLTDYNFRLNACTKLTNVYRDIVEGLASKPFEEPIDLIKGENGEQIAPQSIVDFVQDVDGAGNTLTIFAGATFFNAINSAIDWIFVDYSKPDPTVRTVADARRAGVRPYWSHVLGRNVLHVQSKVVGGEEILLYMRIFEPGSPNCIRIFNRSADGVTWGLFEKTETEHDIPIGWGIPVTSSKTRYMLIDSGEISIGVIPLVPLVTGRRDGRSWRIAPAMQDAADLQIEVYQQESDLKYAKKLTAFPMLAANGISPEMSADGKTPKKLRTGPNRVLYSRPDSGTGRVGNWSYVEPNSESLKFLSDDSDKTKQDLRELGKQPLTAQAGNITVITAAVAAGKAKSAVKAWAFMLKDTIENALKLTALWEGKTYDAMVHVFTNFDEYMEGEDVDALNTMRENEDLSQETLHEEMRRRGILSSNFTTERERKRLLAELPSDGPDVKPEA